VFAFFPSLNDCHFSLPPLFLHTGDARTTGFPTWHVFFCFRFRHSELAGVLVFPSAHIVQRRKMQLLSPPLFPTFFSPCFFFELWRVFVFAVIFHLVPLTTKVSFPSPRDLRRHPRFFFHSVCLTPPLGWTMAVPREEFYF